MEDLADALFKGGGFFNDDLVPLGEYPHVELPGIADAGGKVPDVFAGNQLLSGVERSFCHVGGEAFSKTRLEGDRATGAELHGTVREESVEGETGRWCDGFVCELDLFHAMQGIEARVGIMEGGSNEVGSHALLNQSKRVESEVFDVFRTRTGIAEAKLALSK